MGSRLRMHHFLGALFADTRLSPDIDRGGLFFLRTHVLDAALLQPFAGLCLLGRGLGWPASVQVMPRFVIARLRSGGEHAPGLPASQSSAARCAKGRSDS